MASTYRFYRTNRTGSGTRLLPYDSALRRYTGSFEQWILDPVESATARYAMAFCDSTVHSSASLDADVLPLSPELSDIPAVNVWLDGQLGSVSVTVRNAIEGDRIPVDDIVSTDTRRKLMRRIGLYHSLAQYLRGEFRTFSTMLGPYAYTRTASGSKVQNTMAVVPPDVLRMVGAYADQRRIDVSWAVPSTPVVDVIQTCMRDRRAELLTFIRSSLDGTVADVPVGARTRIQNWMQDKGLDTSWIVGTTTVRAVLKFIVGGLNISPLAFTRVAF